MAIFCNKCGMQLNDGTQFCPGCGTILAAPPPGQQGYAPPPGQQGYTPPPGQQGYAPPPGQQQYAPPQGQYPPPGQYGPPKKGLPKKTLMIIIIAAVAAVVVIVLLNVFGVFGDSKSERDDTSDTSSGGSFTPQHLEGYEKGWPTKVLPSGFPEYPDGDRYYKADGDQILIFVFDTSKKAFDSFADSVEAQGFDLFSMEDGNSHIGDKDGWSAYLRFDPDNDIVSMLISENID